MNTDAFDLAARPSQFREVPTPMARARSLVFDRATRDAAAADVRAAGASSRLRVVAIAAAILSIFGTTNAAEAFEIPTGNDDLALRWDNTIRYNLALRAQKQDPAILGAVNNDDGDRNFSNGSLVANRIDVLSEFDLIWQQKYGIRVSAAGWWDPA